jgi:hypothetical protein
MKRRLLNLLTAMSLLVCVAASVLWARSYVTQDILLIGRGPSVVNVHSTAGSFVIVEHTTADLPCCACGLRRLPSPTSSA